MSNFILKYFSYLKCILLQIKNIIFREKIVQVITLPELNFNNNFDWNNYNYTDQYNELDEYLYNRVKIQSKNAISDINIEDFIDCIKGDIKNDKYPVKSRIDKKLSYEKHNLRRIILNNRISNKLSIDLLYGFSCSKKKNKLIIVLNGFSTSPEKMFGIGKKDYTNNIGNHFLNDGYDVIAPFMFNHGDRISCLSGLLSLNGTTLEWFEINKVKSVIDFITENYPSKYDKIFVYGVSGGGTIALYTSAVDCRIDSVVSSGIVQNRLSSYSDYSARRGDYKRNNFNLRYHYYLPQYPFYKNYTFSNISKLIFPRPLRIECGKNDKILFQYDIESICKEINDIYKMNGNENKFTFFTHDGAHESDPKGTLQWYNNLYKI